jgi:hypothetical protein
MECTILNKPSFINNNFSKLLYNAVYLSIINCLIAYLRMPLQLCVLHTHRRMGCEVGRRW